MAKTLSDFIMILDNVIDPDLCTQLIETFDASTLDKTKRDTDYYSFHEVNITTQASFKDMEEKLRQITYQVHDSYITYTQSTFIPQNHGYEHLRMKKYEVNNHDQFDWHTDVGDYASARRYLVMFYYINSVEDGGDTLFDLGGESYYGVKPKQGRVVCFPPNFLYPHKGCMPISGPKYIISTYGHYL